ncbi:phage portal protein [Oceanidesulfovibrio indonesiensis]|uniref:Phage portal protein n=1 Tax=Oceanidesulfovibrio indonesiensis TaxID=54767 RepID=A0A7M3MD50_9BACT|nr:phage portal protein [Oceanidesulfovibrio indonesiensis]TVM16442.1 phage portal protein [Oceanidesulfovibrio indonesiensis]
MKILDLFRKKETRAVDPSWSALSGLNTATGAIVTSRIAENLSVVLACTNVIATAAASIQAYVYRETENGRDVDERHPLSKLIRRGVNDHQSWPDFVEWLIAEVLLRGNALVEIVTDGAGRVSALKPIPWQWVSVQMLPNGKLAYDVTEMTSIYGGQGKMRRLLEHEVLHLRDRTDDGLIGRARLHRAAGAVEGGLAVQEAANALHRNGLNPSGAFKLDGKLPEDARKQLRQQIEQMHAGAANRGKFFLLDQGLEWQQMTMTPEDAELLGSRKFSVEEMCRIFQVPPPLVQDYTHNTFTNSETAGRWFAMFTVAPWCRKIEAAFTRSVFSAATRDTHRLEFDLSGFLRGDHDARWRGHEIAVKNGILTVNEVRELEGWNPLTEGNQAVEV